MQQCSSSSRMIGKKAFLWLSIVTIIVLYHTKNLDLFANANNQEPLGSKAAAAILLTETQVDDNLNLTGVLLEKFSILFAASNYDEGTIPNNFPQPDQIFDLQDYSTGINNNNKSSNSAASIFDQNTSTFTYKTQDKQKQKQQSNLDEITSINNNNDKFESGRKYDNDYKNRDKIASTQVKTVLPTFFRVRDKVFSRKPLPEVFTMSSNSNLNSGSRIRHGYCAPHVGCIDEIPNFPSLLKKPNVSAIFTVYPQIANANMSLKMGRRIVYEPTLHYQLIDSNDMTSLLQVNQISSAPQIRRSQQQVQIPALGLTIINNHSPASSNNIRDRNINKHTLLAQHRMQHRIPLVMTTTTAASATSANARPLKPPNRRSTSSSSSSYQQDKQQNTGDWRYMNRVSKSQEYPFDMAALEACGFNSALPTRVIIGGYFAKEDEAWIEELIRQWMLLQPASNIIKVSWPDANRGLYHTAAYNSRIVARQLTLFLFYLNSLFNIDLGKIHLVGHSLGAHIAGFVGLDLNELRSTLNNEHFDSSQPLLSIQTTLPQTSTIPQSSFTRANYAQTRLARITGLDPAGPIFAELDTNMRLDPSDAVFVDVIHTNGGSMLKGALGITAPCGHIDYYPNGNVQPGCYFSSMTKSMMDPVERVACNHRRSYRYFIEITKLTAQLLTSKMVKDELAIASRVNNQCNYTNELDFADQNICNDRSDIDNIVQRYLPRAFLFEVKNLEELNKLNQPELNLLMDGSANSGSSLRSNEAPLKRPIEFHSLSPNLPAKGLYYFKTRSESPFFGAKQHALILRTDSLVRKKMALAVKLDNNVVVEADVDEIPGAATFIFVPNESSAGLMADQASNDTSNCPQLSMMWRHRSFNLLLNQQANELHLTGLELSLIDTENEPISASYVSLVSPVTLSNSNSGQQTTTNSSTASSNNTTSIITTKPGRQELAQHRNDSFALARSFPGVSFILNRNRWYKFEGIRLPSISKMLVQRSLNLDILQEILF